MAARGNTTDGSGRAFIGSVGGSGSSRIGATGRGGAEAGFGGGTERGRGATGLPETLLPAMHIQDLLSQQRVLRALPVSSKKRLLEKLGELLGQDGTGLSAQQAFQALIERERLGSTG
ncbi:MAG: PTS sugar transporter subunit IIA, partial [Sorangiineae bacterium]|nr:PTS sugar transporter subunit IIA [Sorangiineae bacterium]